MAIFKRLTEDQIKQNYDHYALFMGIVPIYVGDVHGQCRVAVRNWFPDWLLDLSNLIHSFMPYDSWVIKMGKELNSKYKVKK